MSNDHERIQDATSVEETFALMKAKLSRLVPEEELQIKADLAFRVNKLKRKRNAAILGHNYMEPALYYSVPDYVGDSLELARVSAETDADIIIFCGVRFMAETAKILNPTKTVLLPAEKAGCSLAESISAAEVRELRERFPGVPVVSYVNTYAEVKAESDYCCTSSNAAAVVRRLREEGHERVIFLPDEYLGCNTAAETGMNVLSPDTAADGPGLICWRGRCEVHEQFTVEDVENVRKQFPEVVVLAHPECSREVVEAADFAGSTKQMTEYVRDVDAPCYLLLTECSMGDNIAADNPHREMLRLCGIRCPHMNEITLEQTLAALGQERWKIELPEELLSRARGALDRMIALGPRGPRGPRQNG